MFKRLFGKKENKPKTFDEAKEELLESIREEALSRKVADNFNACVSLLNDENQEDLKKLVEEVFHLSSTLPIPQRLTALSVLTNFYESGYRDEALLDKVVEAYRQSLKETQPFFELLHDRVKQGEEGELEDDVDVESLYRELLKDRNLVSESLAEAVVKVDHFTQCMVEILSVNSSLLDKYKNDLKSEIQFAKDYIRWSYWLERLFDILFDDPILVIDVDNHIGFEGRMSGVSDNLQLQYLLMAMPELNETPRISDVELRVVNGTGVQTTNAVIESKWNMYNLDIIHQEGWEDIKVGPAKTFELKDLWIWGEGSPDEITVHNGRRVILLGRSSYKRSARLQRTFKNMRAGIEVERILESEEIDQWLGFSN